MDTIKKLTDDLYLMAARMRELTQDTASTELVLTTAAAALRKYGQHQEARAALRMVERELKRIRESRRAA